MTRSPWSPRSSIPSSPTAPNRQRQHQSGRGIDVRHRFDDRHQRYGVSMDRGDLPDASVVRRLAATVPDAPTNWMRTPTSNPS